MTGGADVVVVVVGAGAAGLMAAIWAGRQSAQRGVASRIIVVDGAKKLGAKILVAGGGRCNVTNVQAETGDFCGSRPGAIQKVLRRFDVAHTRRFFEEIGVELKEEPFGKLFPTSNRAVTVLQALLDEVDRLGIEIRHPFRVDSIERHGGGGDRSRFVIGSERESIETTRVVLATGGLSLPKTGSDGGGYVLARSLGLTVTRRVFPALVPLVVGGQSFIRGLSGISVADCTLTLRRGKGRVEHRVTGAVLCTHFGISGPAVLDMSRHFLCGRFDDPKVSVEINWLGDRSEASIETVLLEGGGRRVEQVLNGILPGRLLLALLSEAGCEGRMVCAQLTREQRRAVCSVLVAMRVPVEGDRGFTHAEVTAGGVPLAEIDLKTMEARCCPGLHVCGEICDVDGRIGGFNFQWAWSSGYTAGLSVVGV